MEISAGERVLITGASSGIGLATALAYGRRGARVGLLARGADGLERAAEMVADAGGRPLAVPADVTDWSGLEGAVAAAVEELGGLDIAVSSAAGLYYGRFTETPPEDFDRTIATTLGGAVNFSRVVLPALAEGGGSLVIVGSIVSRMPLPLFAGYATAKHGLRGFADSLRVELAEQRSSVSVSLISPGPIDTPLWSNLSSRTGALPPSFPGANVPDDAAAAVVSCARSGCRGRTVGGASVALRALSLFAAPLAERLMRALASYSLDHPRAGGDARPFDEPTGKGRLRGPLPWAHRSLLGRFRRRRP
ncbi:MAG TPA: SDR family NAD(P)-dependent oxidoreductase [Solirubrobacterales bacterium]|nr:SDR family NAD(P)-dependent oxidoreductase [Solirubrobacterales bacterium]